MAYPSDIPEGVDERLLTLDEYGDTVHACFVAGEEIARRIRDETGAVIEEVMMSGGIRQGSLRRWFSNGILRFKTHFETGKEHGVARQFGIDGALLGTYEMSNGTGLDIWWHENGKIAEERHIVDGLHHGCKLWWNEDGMQVYTERFWQRGRLHGVVREWQEDGRLRPGYPEYYIRSKKVRPAEYAEAAESDPSLIRYHKEHDTPSREHLGISL